MEGLLDLLRAQRALSGPDPQHLVDGLVETVRRLDPGHDDDIAVVMLTHVPRRPESGDG